jgi:hypothetical protein
MPDIKHNTSQEQKRPTGITILSILYFLVSLFHLLKFSQVILRWNILQKLPLAVSPFYLAGDGLVWFISGIVLTAGLWKGKSWASPAAMTISVIYGLVFWIDRIWIAQPEGLAQRWMVNLVFTILGLGSIYLTLNHHKNLLYFSKNPAKIP